MAPCQGNLDQVAEIFEQARQLQGDARTAFLDDACGEDATLRADIHSMIEAHAEQGAFLADPIVGAADALREGPGTQIGPYKLLEHIGEGGFGSVFMADQTEPVRRRVAVKVIKLGMDTRQVIARFEAERQALALMEHSNIARVLDAGATETGRPFFVMELVRGDPVTEYCDRQSLSATERLELFKQICGAVQHAHTKGIIHRDIKPTNVLVTVADGKPIPKVIDFGIAKATSGRLTDKTLYTEFRQLIGTPAYMSPEQADASAVDIDTRSDIYALGVLLYELLTGTTPFDAARLRSAGFDEVRRIIREEEPEKPSTRISTLRRHAVSGDGGPRAKGGRTGGSSGGLAEPFRPLAGGEGSSAFYVAEHRRTDPASLTRQLRGDLDWIVMKCLEKDRARRYETANGLALDLQRHLDHEPVRAGPPGAAYRFRKFARRNRVALVAGCAVVASLVVGLALAAMGFVEATQERERAETLAAQRDDQRGRAEANFQLARDAVDRMLTRVADELANQPHMEATRKALLEDALAFYEGFLDEHSDDPAVRSETGRAYQRIGQINEMLGQDSSFMFMRDAMVIRGGAQQSRYGTTVIPEERHRNAEAAYASSIAIHQQLVSEAPGIAIHRADLTESNTALGYLFWRSGRPLEAKEPFEKAVTIGEALVAEFPNAANYRATFGRSLNGLGLVTNAEHSEEAFREALALYEQLWTDAPDEPEHLRFLAVLHNNLAAALCDQGRDEEEDRAFEDAIQLSEQLVVDFPDNPEHRALLALLFENFAKHHAGQIEQPTLRALALREDLATEFPRFPGYRQTLTLSYFRLGYMHWAANRLEDARAANTRAAEIQEELVADFPNEPSFRAQLGLAYRLMGMRIEEAGDLESAATTFRKAVEVYTELIATCTDKAPYVQGVIISYTRLGRVLKKQGRLEEAEAATAEALTLRGGRLYADLMTLVRRSGQGVAEAVQRVRSIDSNTVANRLALSVCGQLLALGEEPERGIAAIQRAIEEGGDTPSNHQLLGEVLLAAGQEGQANAAFTQRLAGFDNWSPTPPERADIDHWTAAYFLDWVDQQQYTQRWNKVPAWGEHLGCKPGYHVGRRMEIEGRTNEAIAAYQKAVELGQIFNASFAANLAAYRLAVLTVGQEKSHERSVLSE